MVKRALLIFLLLTLPVEGAFYQIDVVKKVGRKSAKGVPFVLYRIKKGDTLLKILSKFGIPPQFLNDVARINDIKNPNVIYAGRTLKIPMGLGWSRKTEVKVKRFPELEVLDKFGAVTRKGALFIGDRSLPFSKYPKVSIGGKEFIVDLSGNLSKDLKEKLKEIGFSVVGSEDLNRLIRNYLSVNFPAVEENGTLVLGLKDVLTYHYDFMGYDPDSGRRVVVNVVGDTPKELENILKSYEVLLFQPDRRSPDTEEGRGILKVVSGKGLEKLAGVVEVLTGEKGRLTDLGIEFPKSKVYLIYDYVNPDEKVALELRGYKVKPLSGNFLVDLEETLSAIPLASKRVKLILYEPPGSKGRRSKFEIEGVLVSAKDRDWFLVDSVDRVEEVPYLLYRGVNVIIY